jgi:hypothetical protein
MVSLSARRVFLALIIATGCYELRAISSLANNDPYPIYSSVYDPFLTTWHKQCLKGDELQECCCEHFAFAMSVFFQHARTGRRFDHSRSNLGDLQGFWNMLAMLYGPLPMGANLQGTQLGFAKASIFSDFYANNGFVPPNENQIFSNTNILTEPYILDDPNFLIGFFSVPLKYQKVGARCEFSIQPCEDFGLTIQAGVSEIRQTVTGLTDQAAAAGFTCGMFNSGMLPPFDSVTCPDPFCKPIPILVVTSTGAIVYTVCPTTPVETLCTTPYCQIEEQLMDRCKAKTIFRQIGLNDCNFEETSIEDFRFIFWWRHIYCVNEGRDDCIWPGFLLIPSIEVNAVAPAAKPKERKKLFSAPFGNDGHFSLGLDLGLAIDFVETIEIAAKAGVSYFFARDISHYRIPTDPCQSGIFPFATRVRVQPGLNYNFNAIINAYHFYYNFSAWAEYVMVKHEQDHIKLKTADPAFIVPQAECYTKFVAQFVNGAINYDISPNIAIGIMAQWPISQRNAYRSTTWLATFRIVF